MKKILGPVALLVTGVILGLCGASTRAGDVTLPAAAKAAIEKAFPGAKLGEVERDAVRAVVFEVALADHTTVKLSGDGTILEVEGVVEQKDLPAAVGQRLTSAASGGTIGKIERAEERGHLAFVSLPSPVVTYEARVTKSGKKSEVKIDAAGGLVEDESGEEDEGDEGDEGAEHGR